MRDTETAKQVNQALERMHVTRHSGLRQDRGNVTLLLADPRAARTWGTHTSFAQTYTDLFATPGWQASEFRLALCDRFFSTADWN